MKFLYTALLVALGISCAFAQKQGNQWYFGVYAGLDFNSVPPSPILTSALNSYESCASIADKTTGKLLFYSDGVYVWDSTNTVMPNGGNLGGTVTTSDFNNATGVVSNSVADSTFPGSSGPCGLCFSPHNSKLYVTYNADTSIVYQYNMLECTNSAIIASRKSVGIETPYGGGAIQQGPDDRLYVVRGGSDSLSVIVNPDSLGAKCNFIVDGISLGGKECYLGLPDIIPFYNTLTIADDSVTATPRLQQFAAGKAWYSRHRVALLMAGLLLPA